MRRTLPRLLILLVVVALLLAAIGPLLVNPNPAPGTTSAASVAPAESRFLRIPFPGTDGLRVHYLAPHPGQGQATGEHSFLLLHGFTFNAFTWSRLIDFFGGHGRVAAYDQLPYGLSAKLAPGLWRGPDPYSRAAAIEQLFSIMDALGMEQAVLVGNASGGTLALEAALARPERVSALILLSPWVDSMHPILPDWLAGLPQMRRVSLLLARYLGGENPLLDYAYADPGRIDTHRRQLTGIHRQLANWDVAWGALINRWMTEPVAIREHLAEVKQPALVIAGGSDPVLSETDNARTAAAMPDATLAVLPGCGHLPQEECPALVEQAIAPWLEGLGPNKP